MIGLASAERASLWGWLGIAAAVALAAGWLAITAATGKTYHLAPAVVAAAPALAVRLGSRSPASRAASVGLGFAGLLVALVGWAAIVIVGEEPEATLVNGQPGGVGAEVVALALAGAVGGSLAVAVRGSLTGARR